MMAFLILRERALASLKQKTLAPKAIVSTVLTLPSLPPQASVITSPLNPHSPRSTSSNEPLCWLALVIPMLFVPSMVERVCPSTKAPSNIRMQISRRVCSVAKVSRPERCVS